MFKIKRQNSGNKDLVIIIAIGLVIVAASIFFMLRILGHSEEHLEKVKKTKVAYKETFSWRPDGKTSEARIRADFEKAQSLKKADYGDLVLTEKSLKLISGMSRLDSLKLTRATFKEDWLKHITRLPLSYLGLHGTQITDKSIPVILKMKTLRSISIGDTEITDKGLEALSKSKTITHLDMNIARCITNDGVKYIGNMKQLRQLELPCTRNLTGKCLANITGLKHLSYLNIENMKLEPEDLAILSSFKNLINLDLTNCKLKDEALPEIAKITSLKILDMPGNDITDNGLMKLAKLKRLKRLTIKECPNLNESAVKKLQAKLPECEIKYSRENDLDKTLADEKVKMELEFIKNDAKKIIERK